MHGRCLADLLNNSDDMEASPPREGSTVSSCGSAGFLGCRTQKLGKVSGRPGLQGFVSKIISGSRAQDNFWWVFSCVIPDLLHARNSLAWAALEWALIKSSSLCLRIHEGCVWTRMSRCSWGHAVSPGHKCLHFLTCLCPFSKWMVPWSAGYWSPHGGGCIPPVHTDAQWNMKIAWVEAPVPFVLWCDPAHPLGRTWPWQWSMVLTKSGGHDKYWIQPTSNESELMQRGIISPPEWDSLFHF